jgi:hypothetical protein
MNNCHSKYNETWEQNKMAYLARQCYTLSIIINDHGQEWISPQPIQNYNGS